MAVPAVFTQSHVVVASPTVDAEVVIAQIGGVSSTLPGQTIQVHGWANLAVGANATEIILTLRKDGIAGTVLGVPVGVQVDDTANAGGVTVDVYAADPNENVGGAIYVLTAICTAASAPCTVGSVFLEARVD